MDTYIYLKLFTKYERMVEIKFKLFTIKIREINIF